MKTAYLKTKSGRFVRRRPRKEYAKREDRRLDESIDKLYNYIEEQKHIIDLLEKNYQTPQQDQLLKQRKGNISRSRRKAEELEELQNAFYDSIPFDHVQMPNRRKIWTVSENQYNT